MHSSVKVSTAPQTSPINGLAADLRLVQRDERRSAAAHFWRAVVLCEIVADFLTIIFAVVSGYVIYNSFALGKHAFYPARMTLAMASLFAIVTVLMLDRAGAYRRGNSLLRVRETEQVLRVSAEAFLVLFAVSFFTSALFSRWQLMLSFTLVSLLLFLQKHFTYSVVRMLHARGHGNEKVLIYGAGGTGRRVFSVLKRSPKLGLNPVAFVDDDPHKAGSTIYEMAYERRQSLPVIRGPVTREMIASHGVDLVMVAIPSIARDRFTQTMDEALSANTRVSFVPGNLLPSGPRIDYQDIDGVLLASFGGSTRRVGYEVVKRVCDLAGSLILGLLGAPLLLLLAVAIKIDSAGPVLFRQDRVGRHGKLFRMYKFRTMRADTQLYDYSPRASSDSRITRLGRFLRHTSLDEVPQLLNILQGNMSLVGPRPEMPFIVEQYSERHRQRLDVKPGLTGLWQLSGDRAFLIHENLEYDLYYIQHRNIFMDLAILLHTSIFAMRGI
jgi:exopolysaccharide biosynthesis polyprenyl glycosylphosphotransferase